MILVTGGTGFVGREVVKQLLSLGYKVRLLVRDPRRASIFANDSRVELVQGDALRPETLPAALAGVQAVIHLIGIIVETSKVTYEEAHVEATRNLLAVARGAGVTRWLQMSAAGTRPFAQAQYHLTKWKAEELVRQSGLDWTIFRPSLIYGYDENDRLLNLLSRLLSGPFDFIQLYSFPLLDGGRPLVQPVSVLEVAHCFAHGLTKPASIGHTYDLVGPTPLSWRKMVGRIAAALGKGHIYEEIPIFLPLRALLWLVTILVPCAIVAALVVGKSDLTSAEIGGALWLILAVTAYRWKKLILFNIPGEPIRMVTSGIDEFLPRGLRFAGLLKMAGEDNVGDPDPAMKVFDYKSESFDNGLAKILGKSVVTGM